MKTTKKKPRRRVRPRPMDLRYETQRQWIARLLLLGWTAEQIARHVGRTPRAIRYAISTPEFQTLYAQLQREQLKVLDRRMSRLLLAAVKALARMLKHSDCRARDAATEKILRMHAKYVERIDLTGTLDHTGQVSHVHQLGLGPMDDMTDEQRTLARQLLQSLHRARALENFRLRAPEHDSQDSPPAEEGS